MKTTGLLGVPGSVISDSPVRCRRAIPRIGHLTALLTRSSPTRNEAATVAAGWSLVSTHAAPLRGVPLRVLASSEAAWAGGPGLTLPSTAPGVPVSWPPLLSLGAGAPAPTVLQLALSGHSRRLSAVLASRSTSSPVTAQTSSRASLRGSVSRQPAGRRAVEDANHGTAAVGAVPRQPIL